MSFKNSKEALLLLFFFYLIGLQRPANEEKKFSLIKDNCWNVPGCSDKKKIRPQIKFIKEKK